MYSLDFQHHIREKYHQESGRYKSSNDKGIKISLKKIMLVAHVAWNMSFHLWIKFFSFSSRNIYENDDPCLVP